MFNEKMDEALIHQKMMGELMNSNETTDLNAENMLDVMKQEIAMEQKNKM